MISASQSRLDSSKRTKYYSPVESDMSVGYQIYRQSSANKSNTRLTVEATNSIDLGGEKNQLKKEYTDQNVYDGQSKSVIGESSPLPKYHFENRSNNYLLHQSQQPIQEKDTFYKPQKVKGSKIELNKQGQSFSKSELRLTNRSPDINLQLYKQKEVNKIRDFQNSKSNRGPVVNHTVYIETYQDKTSQKYRDGKEDKEQNSKKFHRSASHLAKYEELKKFVNLGEDGDLDSQNDKTDKKRVKKVEQIHIKELKTELNYLKQDKYDKEKQIYNKKSEMDQIKLNLALNQQFLLELKDEMMEASQKTLGISDI